MTMTNVIGLTFTNYNDFAEQVDHKVKAWSKNILDDIALPFFSNGRLAPLFLHLQR